MLTIKEICDKTGLSLHTFQLGLVTTISRVIFRVKSIFDGFKEVLQEAGRTIMGYLQPGFDAIKSAIVPLINLIFDFSGSLSGAAENSKVSVWKDLGRTIGGSVMLPFKIVAKIIGVVIQFFGGMARVISGAAVALAQKLAPSVKGLFGALGELWSVVNKVAGIFFELIESLIGASENSGTSIWETLGNILGGIVAVGLEIFGSGMNLVISGLTLAAKAVSALIRTFSDFCGWLSDIWSQSSGFGDYLLNVFSAAFDKVKNFLSNINWGETGAAILNTLIDGISATAGKMYDAVAGVFTKVRELLPFSDAKAGPFAQLTGSGAALIGTLIEGIMSKAGAMVDSVRGVFAKVREYMPFSDAKKGPFSKLTRSGMAIPGTLAEGINKNSGALLNSTNRMMNAVELNPHYNISGSRVERLVLRPVKSSLPTPGAALGGDIPFKNIEDFKRSGVERKTINISIKHLELPSVKDAKGFVAALEAIADSRTD